MSHMRTKQNNKTPMIFYSQGLHCLQLQILLSKSFNMSTAWKPRIKGKWRDKHTCMLNIKYMIICAKYNTRTVMYMRWVFMTGIHCYQPVLSIALERIKEPSGLSRRPVTVSVCPDILYNTSFFLRSHTWEHIQMINKIKNMWMKCDHYCNLKLVIRHLYGCLYNCMYTLI